MSEAKKRRLDADLLSEVKDESTMGTYELHPFFLSLCKDKEMPKLHSFSCHNIPHLGVYGEYYHQCLPMVLVCLPAVKELIPHQLPDSVLEALGYTPVKRGSSNQKDTQRRVRPHEDTPLLSPQRPNGESGSLCRKCTSICRCMQWCLSVVCCCKYLCCCIPKWLRTIIWRSFELDQSRSPSVSSCSDQSRDVGAESSFNGTSNTVMFNYDSSMEMYIVFHPKPPESPCQKFLCENLDEVNLMYHCWLFPDVEQGSEVAVSEELMMGVFEAQGVKPVHQDLKDAGVTFGGLDPRTVCIHNSCFSPENAQMQLAHDREVISFFSVARTGDRSVVSFHVLCGSERVEDKLRKALEDCTTLGNLLNWLKADDEFKSCSEAIMNLIEPIKKLPPWSTST